MSLKLNRFKTRFEPYALKGARTVREGGKPVRAYLSELGHQVNIRCELFCVVKPMIKNELVSKVRPEARWSYYSQDYKSPNGLS